MSPTLGILLLSQSEMQLLLHPLWYPGPSVPVTKQALPFSAALTWFNCRTLLVWQRFDPGVGNTVFCCFTEPLW